MPGADGVAADALADEVGRDRLGEADHRRLARPVDIAVRDAADRRGARRDVDDGARFPALGRALEHAGQEGADRAVHRLDVEVEGEIPVLLGAFEHRAVVDEAGAVEEHVDLADRGRELLHRRRVEHVRALRAARQPVSPSSFAASTSVAITSAPSRANASAVARPIPCPAAVRNARLPSNRPITSPLCQSLPRVRE